METTTDENKEKKKTMLAMKIHVKKILDATPVDALVASLTVEERKELARRLLGL